LPVSGAHFYASPCSSLQLVSFEPEPREDVTQASTARRRRLGGVRSVSDRPARCRPSSLGFALHRRGTRAMPVSKHCERPIGRVLRSNSRSSLMSRASSSATATADGSFAAATTIPRAPPRSRSSRRRGCTRSILRTTCAASFDSSRSGPTIACSTLAALLGKNASATRRRRARKGDRLDRDPEGASRH
jgi:hypothetical protein